MCGDVCFQPRQQGSERLVPVLVPKKAARVPREGIMKAAAYARQIESEQYSDVEPMDMPTDVVRPRARKRSNKGPKATHDMDAVLSSDAEEVYVADSGMHRPRKVRKKVGSKNARQSAVAGAAEARTPNMQRRTVAANVRQRAGGNIARRTSVAAAGNNTAGGRSFSMHLRTVRRKNVRLTSLSPPSAQGGTAAASNVTSVPVTPRSAHGAILVRTAAMSRYHLWLKRPAVKTCYGCKQRFAQCYNRPPKDIIIRRFMHRRYTDHAGGAAEQEGVGGLSPPPTFCVPKMFCRALFGAIRENTV